MQNNSRMAGENTSSHRSVCQIRDMAEADVPAVLSIENQNYEFPWTEGILRDCMRAGYYCYVAEQKGTLIGYGIISACALPGGMGGGESHVLNLCIHPDVRRQGCGSAMLRFLMGQARNVGAGCLLLEVRASNKSAISLYQKLGFNEIGVRNAYYPAANGREDALVFACEF